MSSVTGTQDGGPATPLVVPPRGATSGAEITGTNANAPATPFVVPGVRVVAVPTPVSAPTVTGKRKPTRVKHVTTPKGSLAATGEDSLVTTLATLLLGGALWLRRRQEPGDETLSG